VSRVNSKLEFRKCNYLLGSHYVGRLQYENLRETFKEHLKELESLKFDNVENGRNNFRKTICEVADGVLGNKVKTAARNISENTLSDRSYEKKMNVRKLENALKYEVRICGVRNWRNH